MLVIDHSEGTGVGASFADGGSETVWLLNISVPFGLLVSAPVLLLGSVIGAVAGIVIDVSAAVMGDVTLGDPLTVSSESESVPSDAGASAW